MNEEEKEEDREDEEYERIGRIGTETEEEVLAMCNLQIPCKPRPGKSFAKPLQTSRKTLATILAKPLQFPRTPSQSPCNFIAKRLQSPCKVLAKSLQHA